VTVGEALERLRSADARVRCEAARVLAARGDMGAAHSLAEALRDPEVQVRREAEAALWAIWMRSGDPETDALLLEGTRRMEAGDHAAAIDDFSRVIARAPDFAEGYNKRATALYLQGSYVRSIADCEETLRRNPGHFGALSGEGLCYVALGWLDRARRCFRRALAVHPDMPTVRQNLAQLERMARRQNN
jgi:Flp pilus assembly protein TadD